MATPADPLDGLRHRYADALLQGNSRSARHMVEDAARSGTPVEDLYLQVLQPALHEVGDRWERGEISVAQEQVATAVTSAVLAELASRLTAGPCGGGRALVSGTPGEEHALGGRMVADFLAAAGCTVELVVRPASAEAIVERARAHDARIVALSTSLAWLLPEARRVCVALKALPDPPRVIVGGRAYHGDDHVAALVGADAFARDPREMLTLLESEVVLG